MLILVCVNSPTTCPLERLYLCPILCILIRMSSLREEAEGQGSRMGRFCFAAVYRGVPRDLQWSLEGRVLCRAHGLGSKT